MALSSGDKTIITLGVVGIAIFAAWKLVPAFATKLGGSSQSSGQTSGGGVGYGGSDGYGSYQEQNENPSLLAGLINALGNTLNGTGLGTKGPSSPFGSASNAFGTGASAGTPTLQSALYDLTDLQDAGAQEGTYFSELGDTLGDFNPDEATDSGLGSYQIPLQPLQDLQLTGVPVGTGVVGSDSSDEVAQSTGLAPSTGDFAQGFANTSSYFDDEPIGTSDGDAGIESGGNFDDGDDEND
jgi:hypothetical protein